MSSDFRGVPTDKLQAQYDARVDQIRALREENEPLKQELSRRSDAQVMIVNQVIAGNAAALRQLGISEEDIAKAEAFVASEKARKAALRTASAGGAS